MRRASKDDIIHVSLNQQSIIASLRKKRVLSIDPILKPLASKKGFQMLIPLLGLEIIETRGYLT
jgi:hypothetical protein